MYGRHCHCVFRKCLSKYTKTQIRSARQSCGRRSNSVDCVLSRCQFSETVSVSIERRTGGRAVPSDGSDTPPNTLHILVCCEVWWALFPPCQDTENSVKAQEIYGMTTIWRTSASSGPRLARGNSWWGAVLYMESGIDDPQITRTFGPFGSD